MNFQEIIHNLIYAQEQLEDYHVYLSADVFRLFLLPGRFRQDRPTWEEISLRRLYCPMVYPSHYGRGYFGLAFRMPAITMRNALVDPSAECHAGKTRRNPALAANFTAPGLRHISYRPTADREQIETAALTGIDEYLLNSISTSRKFS